jgi:hypothetical protein
MSEKEEISHIVFEKRGRVFNCDSFVVWYENANYLVYRKR